MNLFENLEIVLVCDSNSVLNLNLHTKQGCREFCGEPFFFLLQPLKRFAKASKIVFKLFGENKFKKKRKGGRRCWADRLPFGPAKPRGPVSPSPLPCAGARLAPPDAGHVAAVRRRRGRAAGRPAYPGWDSPTRPQAPFCLLPLPLFFSARERSHSSSDHLGAIGGQRSAARRRPKAALVALSLHQDHPVLIFAAVSPCARSTEVKTLCEP